MISWSHSHCSHYVWFRDGCAELFSLLLEHQVPVLVISAGIGDVISHTLQNFQPQILANFLQTGDKGQISGFKEPCVSVYNKHKFALPVSSSIYTIAVKKLVVHSKSYIKYMTTIVFLCME